MTLIFHQYDEVGNKRFEKDKRNNWTEFSYDERNLLIGVTDPLEYTISYRYDGVGNKRFETDKRGNITEFQYNGRNLLTRTINQVGGETVETVYDYDANGNKISETDPNQNTTRFAYDGLNRLISKTDPLGNTIIYTYDPNGNRTSITDANVNSTYYEYDELNRLTRVTDALEEETHYAYDAVGNKISTTDANDHTTFYEYDEINRLIETIDPLLNSTTYGYDCNGNRTWQNDGNGNIITYDYDKLNRLERRIFPNTEEVTYTYDPNGNRLTMQDSLGLITYQYDALNRLDQTTIYEDKTVSYIYDENSNRISMTSPDLGTIQYPDYDELNRLKTITDPQSGITTYEYDPGSRLIEMTYPSGAVADYDYDDANRLLSQATKKSDGETVITSFEYTYDNVGNRLTMTDLQGTTTYQYDDLYRLTGVNYPDGSWSEYSYDAVGNRIFRNSSQGTVAYQYNQANELVYLSQDYVSSTIAVSGTVSDLDPYGNPAELASVTVNGIPADIDTDFNTFTAHHVPIFLGENQITAVATDLGGKVSQDQVTIQVTKAGENYIEFDYDNNGNLIERDDHGEITTYEYDFENRLIKVTLPDGHTNEFEYDGDKRRISRTTADGTVTGFLYDGINILQDLDESGNIKAAYLQGIGIDKLISVTEWDQQTTSYYHSDAIGSVRSLTDEDGNEVKTYAYDAWGKVTNETGSSDNEYKFTSRRWEEEIGLQFNRARFYDPELGRFITRDPLTGGPDDPTICYTDSIYALFHRVIQEQINNMQPHRHNRYAYCYNNPINIIDPLGLYGINVHLDISFIIYVTSGDSFEGAMIRAFGNQYTDDSSLTGSFTPDVDRLREHHFASDEGIQAKYDAAQESGDPASLGSADHTWQDSKFAHREIVEKGEADHFFSGEEPDLTYTDVPKSLAMCEQLFKINYERNHPEADVSKINEKWEGYESYYQTAMEAKTDIEAWEALKPIREELGIDITHTELRQSYENYMKEMRGQESDQKVRETLEVERLKQLPSVDLREVDR